MNIEDHFASVAASAYSGLNVTVAGAAGYPVGWFRGGVLRHAGLMGFITGHSGTKITLAGWLPELDAAINAAFGVASVPVEIAPGCDLRRETCLGKFNNLLNYGGFPDIPGRNPFGGGSII